MRRVSSWLVAAVLTLAACGAPGAHSDKITVVTSTDVWGSVATAVGGDHAQVRPIINNPAEDPHSYDASPADAAAISDAALVVYNGGEYDHFIDAVLAQHDAVKRVDAFTVGGHAAGTNPHVFFDLATVTAVANAVADQLGAIDSAHAADYRDNAQKFNAQVQAIADAEHKIAEAHPGASAIATEDVAQYLMTATGLTNKTPEGYSKAVDADADPAPADLAAVLDLVNSHAVQVLFYNPQTDTPVVHRIVDAARGAGVPIVEVRETLPAGMDFLSWQRQTVDRLNAALQEAGKPSP
ncbi:MAG: zinc/manganese transport system substrate-binding protein [Mycobacterium sp.]|nr:zinc/manganese transport system substrate-binding protein [Mycobacterium sp.]